MEIQNKILAIGISEYSDCRLNNLANPVRDINAIVAILDDNYIFDDIERLITKEDTTLSKLNEKLHSFFIDALPTENLLVLYSGHGEHNGYLDNTYWQPSDAKAEDCSTWFNISDLIKFIDKSKATHISIISDSCFSGAIFNDNYRGGGIEALNGKKSRLALTSGSIEKVKDGTGCHSPFAETLMNLLEENMQTDLAFNELSLNLIRQFNSAIRQTPMQGSLNFVGHEGGSFIFKLKTEERSILTKNKINPYLKQEFDKLHIPISRTHLGTIESIMEITKDKKEYVSKRDYSEALKLRDREQLHIHQLISTIKDELLLIVPDVCLTEPQQKEISSLESPNSQVHLNDYSTSYKTPEETYSAIKEKDLLSAYQTSGVTGLYKYYNSISSYSQNPYLIAKRASLFSILCRIYTFQIRQIIPTQKGFVNVDSMIKYREFEIEIFNWMNF